MNGFEILGSGLRSARRRATRLGRGALFAIAMTVAGAAGAAASVGQPAPEFSLPDAKGGSQGLAALRGRVVVLEWTNHDCPFVRKHYDSSNMQRLQKAYADKGVAWLSIISSAPGKQGHVEAIEADRLTESRQAAPLAVLLDPAGQVGRAYGARTTPHLYVIDVDGTLVYAGAIDSIRSVDPADIARATPYVKQALDQVLAAQAVSTPVTAPYGCSVKY